MLSARQIHTRTTPRWGVSILLLTLSLSIGSPAFARDTGFGRLVFTANGIEIKVFTYRPPTCGNPSLLFVFHGLNRKAESVRNKAVDVAREACLMVFAPLFDKDRFPNWRYHRGGVVRKGRVQPRTQWTAPVVHALLDLARSHAGNPDAKLYLFGHSAGGQFLSRIAAYAPPAEVERIVIANPSAYVAPILDEAAPYGFEGVFAASETNTRLKAYLALPITVYLGREDTRKKHLVTSPAAMRQGKNRLERGRTIYRIARQVAGQMGWPFNWTLVEAPGVGHSSGGMLRAPAFRKALGLPPQPSTIPFPQRPPANQGSVVAPHFSRHLLPMPFSRVKAVSSSRRIRNRDRHPQTVAGVHWAWTYH